jgi:hypothetical protein
MININKLKAGDVVRRLNSDSIWFSKDDVCTVQLDSENLLCVYTTEGTPNYSIENFPDSWELLKERKLTLEESLREAVDAGFQEALGQKNNAVKHLPMLLEYLKQHSIVARYNYGDCKLFCEAVYYDTVKKKGFKVLEEVEPTLKDVRMWLGY